MARHGLTSHTHIVPGGLTDTAGYAAAAEALESSPTALFVANDIAALGAIAAIQDAGLIVPDDISVVGYDGIAIGGLRSVNLTTVVQPLAELGHLAAEHLVARIEHPQSRARHTRVESRLTVRGTTTRAVPVSR
jgi:DNA-binding LacI/PurR family transcriptional regulator